MTLWIILTLMTSAAAVILSNALTRRFDPGSGEASAHVAVFRQQLAEIDREADEGQVDAAQAEAARVEIKRRLLVADRAEPAAAPPTSTAERKFVTIAVTGIVVLGSVGLYAMTGRPDLSSAPSSAHASSAPEPSAVDRLAAATTPDTWRAEAQSQRRAPLGSGVPLGSVEEMTDRLAVRLREHPKDLEGWRMLGWSYLRTDRFADAADAYRKAIELDPNTPSLRSSLGEALVKVANGRVTGEAKAVFDQALALDRADPGARYYMALAKAQAGDKVSAVEEWIAFLRDANPAEPWIAEVTDTAAEMGREVGIDVPSRLRTSHPTESGGVLGLLRERDPAVPTESAKDPTAEDIRNAEAMPSQDRTAMINGMVERLASRLEKTPRDVDGWIKLIRSRTVLGETQAAKQAFDRAMKVFDDAPLEQSRITAAGREFGLTQ
jgi:cytochrome c-type biogenesis protein CcmH